MFQGKKQELTTRNSWYNVPLSLHRVTFSLKSNPSNRWKGETLFCKLCIRHCDTSYISTVAYFSKQLLKNIFNYSIAAQISINLLQILPLPPFCWIPTSAAWTESLNLSRPQLHRDEGRDLLQFSFHCQESSMVFSVCLQAVSGSMFRWENHTPEYMCIALNVVWSNMWC